MEHDRERTQQRFRIDRLSGVFCGAICDYVSNDSPHGFPALQSHLLCSMSDVHFSVPIKAPLWSDDVYSSFRKLHDRADEYVSFHRVYG